MTPNQLISLYPGDSAVARALDEVLARLPEPMNPVATDSYQSVVAEAHLALATAMATNPPDVAAARGAATRLSAAVVHGLNSLQNAGVIDGFGSITPARVSAMVESFGSVEVDVRVSDPAQIASALQAWMIAMDSVAAGVASASGENGLIRQSFSLLNAASSLAAYLNSTAVQHLTSNATSMIELSRGRQDDLPAFESLVECEMRLLGTRLFSRADLQPGHFVRLHVSAVQRMHAGRPGS